MTSPHDRDDSGLSDLFDNLPTASSSLPQPAEREAPRAGSRRALREQAAREAADTQKVEPAEATPAAQETPAAAQEAPPVAQEPHDPQAAADDFFAQRFATQPAAEPAAQRAAEVPAAEKPASDDHESMHALFAPEKHKAPPTKRKGRGCLIAAIIVLVIFGGIAAGGAWVWSQYGDKISDAMGWGEPKDYEPGEATGEALVTIKSGDTGSPVSTALYKAGVTKTDRVFYEWLLKENPSVTFYPGVYKLQKKMTAEEALKALQNEANRMENTVRIAEGGTVESSLPRIVDGVGIPLEELQAAVADPSVYGVDAQSLEGWLFPAVYTFDPGASAQDVIARMVERTRESLRSAGVPDDQAQRVLTIASIIEREGRTADFPKISRVIQNRIDKGWGLEMDSTAQYGYGELHAGSASTSKEAQRDDNPWNTYVIKGLPVTPIANPGDAAIDAAMHPVDGPWMFFVTINMNTGETQFSETLREHEQGVQKMIEWCRANPGTGC